MIEKLKHKYALSSKGAKDMVRAFVAVTLSNLVLMLPVGLLYVLSSYLLDQQLPKEKLTFFICEIVVILICIALTTTFQYRSTFLSTYIESGVRRRTLAEKLRKLPLSYFGKKDLADLTNTIMSDCALLETASSHWIPELIGAMISTTIIVISLFFFDFRMALAAIWVMPIAFAIVLYSRKAMRKTHEKTNEYRINCLDGIQEGLETLRDLRSNNMCDTYMKSLNKKIKAVENHAIFAEFTNAAFVCSAQMILKLGMGTVTLVGSYLLVKDEITVHTFFMFLLVVTRMYEPLQISLQNLSAMISLDTNCKRMDEILSHEEQTGGNILTNEGYDIVFDHVAFSYNQKEKVLSDVSFVAKQGEVTALIGPSGGGKTTISRLAARFYDINQGKITIGGMDVSKVEPEKLLELYSIVFQDVTLFNNTVMENIRMSRPKASDEEVMQALKNAQCQDIIDKFPDGVHTVIGSKGVYVSGGESQRLSIARAFLKNAPILILDEATAFADPDNEVLVQKAFEKLSKNKTVVMIAHRLSTIINADCIYVLENGRIVESGKHEELLKTKGVYEHMWHQYNQSVKWKVQKGDEE